MGAAGTPRLNLPRINKWFGGVARVARSTSFYDTCVPPRYRNGPTGRRRLTAAEALELEGMDSCYIDIDGLWPKGADIKSPESVPVANQYYSRIEIWRKLSPKPNGSLETASVMRKLIHRKSSWVANVTIEPDALGVN